MDNDYLGKFCTKMASLQHTFTIQITVKLGRVVKKRKNIFTSNCSSFSDAKVRLAGANWQVGKSRYVCTMALLISFL